MQSTLFILRYRLRALGRAIRAHGFEIFCLGPVIVGGTLWVADRNLGHLREPLTQRVEAGVITAAQLEVASLVLALLLVAISLPACFRELYGHRRAAGVLDTLPVSEPVRFYVSLALEGIRCLPALVVLLILAGALGGEILPPLSVLIERVIRLLGALIVLAMARLVTTMVLVHWRSVTPSRWQTAGRWLGLTTYLALGLVAPHPALTLLLLPWLAPAAQLEVVVRQALGVRSEAMTPWGEPWALAVTALVLLLLSRALYLAWRRRDLEVASRLTVEPRSTAGEHPRAGAGLLPQLFSGLAPPGRFGMTRPLAAQIVRDLGLVRRRFSLAVPLSLAAALVFQAIAATLLLDARLDPLWRQRLAVVGLTLSALAAVALVPFLLKHQLPRFWIEKSIGVELEQIWRAKLWLAGLLATAPFLAGALLLALTPDFGAVTKVTIILQLGAATLAVASILGLAVFEIAAQPLLGLVFGSLVGLAMAALFVFYPQGWWLWLVFYGYVAGQIAGRATRRVRLVEVEARANS
ncbi:MAG: hypothetical protein AAF657_37350 [Acidobacteriota bacterium]